MKLATAPVNWNSPDVPEYREYTPYPQLLEEMLAAGYTATEWSSIMPKDPEVLRRDLQARGMKLIGGFVGLELRDPAKRAQEISKGQWNSLGSGLNELATALKPAGIQLVFHNHVGSYVETEAETCRLLDETDPSLVGWCLDCGHLAYGGGDTLKMLEKYGNRVGHVHLKDVNGEILVRALEEQWSFHRALKAYIFAKLGDGIVSIPSVIKALAASGYDGWVVLEQDTTPDNPTNVARENRVYLESLLQ